MKLLLTKIFFIMSGDLQSPDFQARLSQSIKLSVDIDGLFRLFSYRIVDHSGFVDSLSALVEEHLAIISKLDSELPSDE